MTDPLIDPSSSALLVMDYQIDVLEKFMAPADSTEVLSVLPKLLAVARSADPRFAELKIQFGFGRSVAARRQRCLSAFNIHSAAFIGGTVLTANFSGNEYGE